MQTNIKYFAHRGVSSKAPENTMPAFELAVNHGVYGIELDVHLTKDGKLAVIHDESTRRTTGEEFLVGQLTSAELKKLDSGSWFNPEFAGTRIPLLEEVLELIAIKGTILNIELKNSYIEYPGLEEKTLAAIRQYHMQERIVISSFNHISLNRMHQLCPELECAPLYDARLYDTAGYTAACGCRAIHPHWRTLDKSVVAPVQQAGIAIRPWTVNNAAAARAMLDLGIDTLITNYPYDLFQQK